MSKTDLGFEIDYLPVGKGSKGGDAIALRYGRLLANPVEQVLVVIDGGYSEDGDRLYDLITNRYGTKHVNLIISTHPDKDHASGLSTLIEKEDIDIGAVLMHRPWNNDNLDASVFKDGRKTDQSVANELREVFGYAYAIEQAMIAKYGNDERIREPEQGQEINEGVLRVLGPSDELYVKKILESGKTSDPAPETGLTTESTGGGSDETETETLENPKEWPDDPPTAAINDTSVVLLFEYAGKRILFTGDSGKEGLIDALDYARYNEINARDVSALDIPHHGSRKNLEPRFITYIKPERAFLSAPPDDSKHPSQRLINEFVRQKIKVFSTQGSSLHWGVHAPDRGWTSATPLEFKSTIDK